MTLQGKLARADFGPGAWVLEQADGDKVQLVGDVPADLLGCKVHVTGTVMQGGVGFAMVGSQMIQVKAIRKA